MVRASHVGGFNSNVSLRSSCSFRVRVRDGKGVFRNLRLRHGGGGAAAAYRGGAHNCIGAHSWFGYKNTSYSGTLCLSSRSGLESASASASASQSGAGITDVSFSGGGSGETSSSSSSSLTTLPAQISSSSFSSSSSSDYYSDHSQVLVYLTRNNNSLNSAEENNLNEVVSKHDVQDAELASKTGGEQRRRAVLASRAFCRCVLARTLREHGLGEWEPAELPLSRDKNGKPALNISSTGKGNVAFSVSHTTGLLACAVSLGGRTVGVDIENGDRALRGSPEDRARRLFSQDEADDVARRGNGAFLEKWTLKEAYLKATGEGINARRRLRDVTFTYEPPTWHDEDGHAGVGVRVNDASPPKAFADIPSLRWGVHLTRLPALEHVMAVCVLDDDRADDYKSDYEMPHLLEPQMWLTDTLATDVTRL